MPSIWTVPSALAVVLLSGLLAYVWRRPPPSQLRPWILVLLVGALVFTLGDLFSMAATTAPAERGAGLAIYGGLSVTAFSCWMLALRTAELHAVPFSFGRSRLALLPGAWLALLWLTALTDP